MPTPTEPDRIFIEMARQALVVQPYGTAQSLARQIGVEVDTVIAARGELRREGRMPHEAALWALAHPPAPKRIVHHVKPQQNPRPSSKLLRAMRAILAHPHLLRREIAMQCGVSKDTVTLAVKMLKKEGKL